MYINEKSLVAVSAVYDQIQPTLRKVLEEQRHNYTVAGVDTVYKTVSEAITGKVEQMVGEYHLGDPEQERVVWTVIDACSVVVLATLQNVYYADDPTYTTMGTLSGVELFSLLDSIIQNVNTAYDLINSCGQPEALLEQTNKISEIVGEMAISDPAIFTACAEIAMLVFKSATTTSANAVTETIDPTSFLASMAAPSEPGARVVAMGYGGFGGPDVVIDDPAVIEALAASVNQTKH